MTGVQQLLTGVSALFLLAVGMISILRPNFVRASALKSNTGWAAKLNPFGKFIEGSHFTLMVRLIGGLAIVMSALLFFGLASSRK
jgi:hypothetical protein